MALKITKAVLSELSDKEIADLRLMTLKYDSGMKDILDDVRHRANVKIAIASRGIRKIGWALHTNWYMGHEPTGLVMVFVRIPFRRQGVGSLLVKEIKTISCRSIYWNTSSNRFYKSCGVKDLLTHYECE